MNLPNQNTAGAFGERLKETMAHKGIKQVDLINQADTLGFKLGKSQVSQYVSGKTIPRKDTLSVLAQILGVDPLWLLQGENTPQKGSFDVSLSHDNGGEFREGYSSQIPVSMKGTHMREFRKSSKLDNVLYDVRGPVVDEAARMEAEGTRILKLNIGNPAPFGFSTPDEVIYDMRQQLVDCQGYSDAKGMLVHVKRLCNTLRLSISLT